MNKLNKSINNAVKKVLISESKVKEFKAPIEIDVKKFPKRNDGSALPIGHNLKKWLDVNNITFFAVDNVEYEMDIEQGSPFVDYIESMDVYLYVGDSNEEPDPLNIDEFAKNVDDKVFSEFNEFIVAFIEDHEGI